LVFSGKKKTFFIKSPHKSEMQTLKTQQRNPTVGKTKRQKPKIKHETLNRELSAVFDVGLDCIIPSGLERLRPQSLVVLVHWLVAKGNEMLHVEHVDGADVTRELEAVSIRIDLLDDLHGSDLFGLKLVVVAGGEAFLGEDSPNKVADLKFDVPAVLVSASLVASIGGGQVVAYGFVNV